MTIQTDYGEFQISETSTGIMAEHLSSGDQLFIENEHIPARRRSVDYDVLVYKVEQEYEHIYDLSWSY